jgi:hypothetical protein
MAAFLAKQVAKKATPFIRDVTDKIKKEGIKQAGNLQQARKKCQNELQQCIKTETAKMKQEIGGLVEDTGRKLKSGGKRRKRRRSRKGKRSGKRRRTRKRSRKRSRTRKRRR